LATAVSEGADEGVEQQAQVVKKGEGVWGGGMKNNGGAGAAKKNKGDGGGGGNTIPIIKPSQQQQPQQGQQGYVTLEPDANFTAEEVSHILSSFPPLLFSREYILKNFPNNLAADHVQLRQVRPPRPATAHAVGTSRCHGEAGCRGGH